MSYSWGWGSVSTTVSAAGPPMARCDGRLWRRLAQLSTQLPHIGSPPAATLCFVCAQHGATRLEPLYFGVTLMALAYVVVPAVATANPRALRWHVLLSVGGYNYSTLLGGRFSKNRDGEDMRSRASRPRWDRRGSVLLALLRAGWHLPMFFYPGWITAPPWTYVLIMIGVTTIRTYATNLARASPR